jgi:hypothetical protein
MGDTSAMPAPSQEKEREIIANRSHENTCADFNHCFDLAGLHDRAVTLATIVQIQATSCSKIHHSSSLVTRN